MSIEAIQYARSVQPRADGELLSSERHLLLLLGSYHDMGKGYAWPSVGRLAREMGVCKRRVQQLIRSAQRKGVLVVRCCQPDERGKQPTNRYSFPGLEESARRKPASPVPEAGFTQGVKPVSPTPLKPASPYKHLESQKKESERKAAILSPCEGERIAWRGALAALTRGRVPRAEARSPSDSDQAFEARKEQLREQARRLGVDES